MKKYRCPNPKCRAKNNYILISGCVLCNDQHIRLECKVCGQNWNEWDIKDKNSYCCGDPERYL